ncbi:hypothetical protein PMAYCL1PPCAC_04796, partial [Pristionchus mayeri]
LSSLIGMCTTSVVRYRANDLCFRMNATINLSPVRMLCQSAFAKFSITSCAKSQSVTVLPSSKDSSTASAVKEIRSSANVLVTEQRADVPTVARNIANERKDNESSFMIYNLDALYDRYKLWMRELPQVEPFYAVKCNSDEMILRTLASLGTGFDCASRVEMDSVLRLGVAPERIIFAHPCKPHSFISHASQMGVGVMTFDNPEELEKVASHHKRPKLILRIATSDQTAKNRLSMKFGADHELTAPNMLHRAADMGIPIVGISFHVGNGCNDPAAYHTAINHSRTLFDIGRSLGHNMELVDVGGGYPGDDQHPTTFEKIAAVIRSALEQYFPERDKIRIIGEPGRFFAMKTCSLVTSVMARAVVSAYRITKNTNFMKMNGYMYYMNDGVFGSFSNNISYDERPSGKPLFEREGELYPSIIWGPTCDCIDKIEDNKMMRALDVGESLIYKDMGAYTSVLATSFNGFPRATPIYMISKGTWQACGF